MRILMTGSRGFIGGHLRRELESHGHDVWGFDRAPLGYGVAQPSLDLQEMVGDVAQPGDFAQVLGTSRGRWDRVVHLAAQVGREFGEDDIMRTITWNATGTALVARACGEARVPVTYTSTSEIYGDHAGGDVDELTKWRLPHNLYGLSKRWGEEALGLYAPWGLQVARLSMPYGPGAPPGRGRRAMDNFLWQANTGQPITVHRNSERSWCWVGDTVRALRFMVENGREGSWNVGRDDDPRPMLEIAEMACDIAGASYDLIREVDPPQRITPVKRLSTERLRRDFGWAPTVELEQGMLMLWDWIKRFDESGERKL